MFVSNKKNLRIFTALASEKVVFTLQRIFEAPLFIKFWGIDLWSDWLVAISICQVLGLITTGFNDVTRNKATMLFRVSLEKQNIALQTLNIFFSLGITFLLLIFFILINHLEILRLISLNQLNFNSFNKLVLTLLLFKGLELLKEVPFSILSSKDKLDKAVKSNLIFYLLNLTPLIIVPFSSDPMTLAIGLCISSSFGLFYFWINTFLHTSYKILYLHKSILSEIRILIKNSLSMNLFPIGNLVSLSGIRIMSSQIFNAETFILIVILSTLKQSIIQFSGIFSHSYKNKISIYYGCNDVKNFLIKSREAVQLSSWFNLLLSVFILFFSDLIISFWTLNTIKIPFMLVFIMVFAALLEGVWRCVIMQIVAINEHKRISFLYISVYGFLNVFIFSLLGILIGLYGAILSFLVISIIMLLGSLKNLKHYETDLIDWILSITRFPTASLSNFFLEQKNSQNKNDF